MEIIIVESEFCSIFFDPELHLFTQIWYPKSEDMDDDDYKRIHSTWVKKLMKHRYDIRYIFLDNRENCFTMSPELQEWQAENILKVALANLPNPDKIRQALLMSEDFMTSLSIEQAMEENPEANDATKYFTDEIAARDWLWDA